MGLAAFHGSSSSADLADEVIEDERSINEPYWRETLQRPSGNVLEPDQEKSAPASEDEGVKASASVRAPAGNSSSLMGTFNRAGQLIVGSAAVYHGYKRNESIGWALVWGILGSAFWPITAPIMLAQGFGQPKKK